MSAFSLFWSVWILFVTVPGEDDGPRVLVHLVDGRPVSGRIVDFDEGEGILLRRDDNGGRLPLKWHQMLEDDVAAVKRLFGFVGDEPPPVRIEALEVRTKTGTVVGLAEGTRDGKLLLRRRDHVLEIPLSQLAGPPHTVTVDALEVANPEDVYRRRREEKPPVAAVDYYNMGLLAESLTLFDQARRDFETCLELDPAFPKRAAIEAKTASLEARAKEREQAEVLREIQALRYRGRFSEAMAKALDFEQRWPDSTLLQDVQREKRRVAEGQRASILRRIRADFFTYLRRACEAKARDEEIELGAAMTWAKEEAYAEVRGKLAELYGVEEEKVDELWDQRPKSGSPIRASYDGGTFVLGEEAKAGYDRKASQEEQGAAKEEKKEAKTLEERIRERLKEKAAEREKKKQKKRTVGDIADVPPKPEDWWKGARSNERTSFLLAFFAEHSGKVELLRPDRRDCSLCSGKGVIEFYGTTGGDQDSESAPCPRCKTLTFDRIVVFR